MKLSLLGTAALAMVVGSTSLASADQRGYDPLALDHFVEANLAMTASKGLFGKKGSDSASKKMTVAGNGLRYDSQGYLIGADGKRVKNQMRIRWQVGVFR